MCFKASISVLSIVYRICSCVYYTVMQHFIIIIFILCSYLILFFFFFFFQAEDGIRDVAVTGVQTCALPIYQQHGNTLSPADAADERGDGALAGQIEAVQRLVEDQQRRSPDERLRDQQRSEERRVGEEGRTRWSPDH